MRKASSMNKDFGAEVLIIINNKEREICQFYSSEEDPKITFNRLIGTSISVVNFGGDNSKAKLIYFFRDG